MKGIQHSLVLFKEVLRDKVVKVFTDNKNCESIVSSGSTKPDLHSLALDIFSFCVQNSISLEVQWIPRTLNAQADAISRIIDYDDWGVSWEFFCFLDRMFGPHDFDRFADCENTKVPVFNSRYYSPGSSGVDAFSFSWRDFNNWLVPPPFIWYQGL